MKKEKRFMKKPGCLAAVAILGVAVSLVFSSCGSATESYEPVTNQTYAGQYDSYGGYEPGNDDVKDWMKDQVQGKAYGYDDGGSYYCMGKNDTCKNKTNNKYDLYCNSCDPDGDNIEG